MTDQQHNALKQANKIRLLRTKQRAELRGCDPAKLTQALIDPPLELASYRLRELFAQRDGHNAGKGARNLIPRFHRHRLNVAIQRFNGRADRFRQVHAEHRLRDLTRRERELLAVCIVAEAPRAWREARPAPMREAA